MNLPTTPANRWFSELERPFRLFEDAFDVANDYRLHEEDDAFVLTIDVPGFERDEITVTWDDGVLNVSGEHTDETVGRRRQYHRQFQFPKRIDDDEITATYTNGVLEVTLPQVDDAMVQGKEIPIED
jgi:HSP20 family protein